MIKPVDDHLPIPEGAAEASSCACSCSTTKTDSDDADLDAVKETSLLGNYYDICNGAATSC